MAQHSSVVNNGADEHMYSKYSLCYYSFFFKLQKHYFDWLDCTHYIHMLHTKIAVEVGLKGKIYFQLKKLDRLNSGMILYRLCNFSHI